jgi:hypothetical protein
MLLLILARTAISHLKSVPFWLNSVVLDIP